MSEIRQDPTTKEWVIIATERGRRPHEFSQKQARSELPAFLPSCPFCPGNEAMTPAETYMDHKSGTWRVRAFPNKFPALTPDGTTRREVEGTFLSMDGVGAHEVVVETPLHNEPLALMEDSEVLKVLLAYQQRYLALSQLPFVKLIIIFKNHGVGAGTSLEHPHSQIVATPVVPNYIRMQYEVAIRHYDDTGRCLYSDLADNEIKVGQRVVLDTKSYAVFQPFASCRPFETWIVPKTHRACFGNVSEQELEDLAHVLRIALLKLYRGLDDPDYNCVVYSAPIGDEKKEYYLWHLRIIPRLTEVAGFEIGSGIYINTALPEETARFMRELSI